MPMLLKDQRIQKNNYAIENQNSHLFCVAPMMTRTDRHTRYFHRLFSKNARLYTEMVPLFGLLYGQPERFLTHDEIEQPLALQIGGNDPRGLSEACIIAEEWGFNEINLNLGCPSKSASHGEFGACLMTKPKLVSKCISAMTSSTQLPITVKCRLGVDNMDQEKSLDQFISMLSLSGANTIIIHARKAMLNGISPKDNRTIPPLNYERVYRLKDKFPEIKIILNGGIKTLKNSMHHLKYVDGVMLGRAVYDYPYVLAQVDSHLFNDHSETPSKMNIIRKILSYCKKEIDKGTKINHITRHLNGLFRGCRGSKRWRKSLSLLSNENFIIKSEELLNTFTEKNNTAKSLI